VVVEGELEVEGGAEAVVEVEVEPELVELAVVVAFRLLSLERLVEYRFVPGYLGLKKFPAGSEVSLVAPLELEILLSELE